ncbi:LADA_0H12310g1_1 [Lachancea dasiensis]|uniref:LADA_0H12310g1_1 n=1 Tax=Lachancea dasiensis TaxID=1072105 RepID=A0A1G4K3P5_9SACH|nr:LADA_0H12310g1_1 [Lachancea dasiensis]
MPNSVPFKQVDVFTSVPFQGNPVAVVNCWNLDEKEVHTSLMQKIANWTNLSETTFLFKPTIPNCDYKVRIFCPQSELPFAGHPTIGTCKAYLEFSGRKDVTEITQECGLGAISLSLEGETLSFKGAKTNIVEISDKEVQGYGSAFSTKLIERARLLEVGPKWVVALVRDSKACFEMDVDFVGLNKVCTQFDATGVIIAGKYADEDKYEMRAFAPRIGVNEDPVCGSGSLALARYLQEVNGYKTTYSFHISQGGRVGRAGQVSATIQHKEGEISYFIGGEAVTAIDGQILL